MLVVAFRLETKRRLHGVIYNTPFQSRCGGTDEVHKVDVSFDCNQGQYLGRPQDPWKGVQYPVEESIGLTACSSGSRLPRL